MRNSPLRAFAKKSPMRGGGVSTAIEIVKPLVGGVAKKALGLVGAFIDPTTTSTTDQPKYHGGPTDKKKYPGGKIKFGS